MYRIWLEEILGLQVRHGHLRVQPTIPSDWTSFAIAYRYGRSTYEITVENPAGVSHGVSWVELDGVRSETGTVELVDDRFKHRLRVRMGPPAP
jgi:cyclic beta-1,2-glucan synthetase